MVSAMILQGQKHPCFNYISLLQNFEIISDLSINSSISSM
jgi:hypothetical protein